MHCHLFCLFIILTFAITQDQAYAEQVTVRGEGLPPLEYDQLKQLEFLDRCLKETLRLRPPLMTMMRMIKTPQVYLLLTPCSFSCTIHMSQLHIKLPCTTTGDSGIHCACGSPNLRLPNCQPEAGRVVGGA